MQQITTVWKKELRDTFRDRRTVMSMLVMPIIAMPLIILGISKLTANQVKKMGEQPIHVAVQNEAAAPHLVALFKSKANATIIKADAPLAVLVQEGKIDVGVLIPPDFQAKLMAELPVEISLVQNSINSLSNPAVARVENALAFFNQELVATRLAAHGVNPTIMTGVTSVTQDISNAQQRGGYSLSFILPLLIMMWALIGGQYTAIDASAGERERKTLVPLFLTPAKRLHIITGKFLAVATVALISVIVSLISMFFTIRYAVSLFASSANPSMGMGMDFSFDLPSFLLIFFISLLLVTMFSALLLSIGIFAKSFKEAQSYISPFYMLILLPIALINGIPGLTPGPAFFAIPGINVVALFKEIFVRTYNPVHIGLTIGSLLLGSVLAIVVATQLYKKESVLFKK